MAGLGRKEFNSGDILLASEVQGYLQDQAVMVFDDAAARGSAIPSPSEGMLTYNKDTDQLELYDGAAFGPVGSDAGLVHINTTAFSAVSAISLNNVFSATYDNYSIVFNNLIGSSATFASIRLRASGTDASGNNYNRQLIRAQNTTIQGSRDANINTFEACVRYDSGSTKTIANLFMSAPFLAAHTTMHTTDNEGAFGTGVNWFAEMFNHALTNSYDGFTILAGGASTITGSVSVFGWKK